MKREIRIKIETETQKNILSDYASPFDIDNTTKVSDVKTKIKEGITIPYEFVKDIFYFRNKELKDTESIGEDGTLSYKLIVK